MRAPSQDTNGCLLDGLPSRVVLRGARVWTRFAISQSGRCCTESRPGLNGNAPGSQATGQRRCEFTRLPFQFPYTKPRDMREMILKYRERWEHIFTHDQTTTRGMLWNVPEQPYVYPVWGASHADALCASRARVSIARGRFGGGELALNLCEKWAMLCFTLCLERVEEKSNALCHLFYEPYLRKPQLRTRWGGGGGGYGRPAETCQAFLGQMMRAFGRAIMWEYSRIVVPVQCVLPTSLLCQPAQGGPSASDSKMKYVLFVAACLSCARRHLFDCQYIENTTTKNPNRTFLYIMVIFVEEVFFQLHIRYFIPNNILLILIMVMEILKKSTFFL